MIYYDHLIYVGILWTFDIFLVNCTKKNLATLPLGDCLKRAVSFKLNKFGYSFSWKKSCMNNFWPKDALGFILGAFPNTHLVTLISTEFELFSRMSGNNNRFLFVCVRPRLISQPSNKEWANVIKYQCNAVHTYVHM
jgi:hypothetical protein